MSTSKSAGKVKRGSRTSREEQPVQVGLPQVPPMYGLKGKSYLPWQHAEDRLVRLRNYWICTSRPDGRPHSTPVWGMWVEGALYFGTARASRT